MCMFLWCREPASRPDPAARDWLAGQTKPARGDKRRQQRGAMLFRAPEYEVDVFVHSFLVGKLLGSDFFPTGAESEGIAVEMVDGLRRRALQHLAPSGAGGELPVHVFGLP